MKKIFFAVAMFVVALATTGCTKLLLSEPRGNEASEEQVESNVDALEYSLSGLYNLMYSGSDQSDNQFQQLNMIEGQKYIDVMSDIIASDAAVPHYGYGWMSSRSYMDQYLSDNRFNRWLWKYEYNNIRNANMIIKRCNNFLNSSTAGDEIKATAKIVRAQAVVLRSHFYSNLFNFYVKPGDTSKKFGIIYYDENNMEEVQGLSDYKDVVAKVIEDTKAAIADIEAAGLQNPTKFRLDANIAKMILAYIHLNRGRFFDETKKTESCTEALRLANEVIAATKAKHPILPYAELKTNGFNSVKSKNWMWGLDVTTEKTYSIYCFFSFVDIYTYGYASVNGFIGIDKGVYEKLDVMLDPKDGRKEWWSPALKAGGNTFNYVADNKYFTSVGKRFQGDRNWENDYCFMRSEEAYLVAAEAAYVLGNEAEAKTHLKELVAQRSPENNAIDGLTGDALKDYIQNNWRIECWLEGKTFMALKRFRWDVVRSTNHFYHAGKTFKYTDDPFTFLIPDVETNYNPKL